MLLDEIARNDSPVASQTAPRLAGRKFSAHRREAKEIQVNVRVLCATHADIPKAIEAGKFRHDLFYRINTVQMVLPPLRERREDIALLAHHFLSRFATLMGKDITGPSLRLRSINCSLTRGPATSVNSSMCCNAPWPCASNKAIAEFVFASKAFPASHRNRRRPQNVPSISIPITARTWTKRPGRLVRATH